MADVASRQHATNHKSFLVDFTSTFPPPQGNFWQGLQLHERRIWKIFSILLERPSTMASWRQLSRKGKHTGTIGRIGSPSMPLALTTSSSGTQLETNNSQEENKLTSWRPTAAMYDTEAISKAPKQFEPRQLPWLSEVSPQSVNWMQNLTSWEARKISIQKRFDNCLKVLKDKTHQANQDLQ